MIVVDTAAIVDALTVVEGTEDLRADLAAEELHAPALLDFEFVSALRGLTFAGRLSVDRAYDGLADFDALPIRRWADNAALRLRAYTLRNNLTACDAAYVALAEVLDCPIVTRDRRLAATGGHRVVMRVR